MSKTETKQIVKTIEGSANLPLSRRKNRRKSGW